MADGTEPVAELIGYEYDTGNSELSPFSVIRTDKVIELGGMSPHAAARVAQGIIQVSLADRFSETLDLEQISKTANPNDEQIVQRTMGSFFTSKTGTEGAPIYWSATVSDVASGYEQIVAGIGKLEYADGRPRWQRVISSENSANLADVGDVYVRPAMQNGRSLQRKGIGSAILRTMLDECPVDMPTIIYEFPNLESGLPSKLEAEGFRANGSRVINFCDVETAMVNYRGPLCGDLIELLEAKSPWLADRDPIVAPA